MKRDELMEQLIADARADARPGSDATVVLAGDARDAYLEFCAAARELEWHQREGAVRMKRYQDALARLSAHAAKAP